MILNGILHDNHDKTLIHFPKPMTNSFSSRGLIMAEIQGHVLALEPDGQGGHWTILPPEISDFYQGAGEAELEVTEISTWPSPTLPRDVKEVLLGAGLMDAWESLTSRSQWSYLRWIRFTKNPDTRKKRIEVTANQLSQGKRRPCCFDHSRCTDPAYSKNGLFSLD